MSCVFSSDSYNSFLVALVPQCHWGRGFRTADSVVTGAWSWVQSTRFAIFKCDQINWTHFFCVSCHLHHLFECRRSASNYRSLLIWRSCCFFWRTAIRKMDFAVFWCVFVVLSVWTLHDSAGFVCITRGCLLLCGGYSECVTALLIASMIGCWKGHLLCCWCIAFLYWMVGHFAILLLF